MHVGVPLPGSVYDEHGNMLLSKGQVLDSETQLATLLERGMYVEVGVFEAQFRQSASTATATVIENKFDPFLVRGTTKLSLNRLLRSITDGSGKPEQILEFARHVEEYAATDPEAAIAAGLLDRQEESRAAAHSLSCAVLCSLLAKRLEWPQEKADSVVCAALTMNLGMLDLQQKLMRQNTPLNPAQQSQVHAHPETAAAALQAVGVSDPVWLGAVREHHENPKGNGYPQHLASPSEASQLVRLSDVFFGRASLRADRAPQPPAQIIRTLFVEEGQGPNGGLVASLVKLIGMYPPGCFVKLADHEVAVVFRPGSNPKTPIVAAVTNANGVPAMQPTRRDTERDQYAIAGTVTPDKVSLGYDLGKLWLSSVKRPTAG